MWEQSQIKRTLNRPESLARVNALLQGSPELHRTALADRVRATFGFRDARGRVQRAGCLKALRASNWHLVGETGGRGRQDRGHAAGESRKAIYLYELEPDWRARLGVGPAPARGDAPLEPAEGLDAEQWAEHEFGGASLGDKRLTKRLVDSARRQGEDPLRAFTAVARDDWAAVKGYYRLIDQPEDSEVTPSVRIPVMSLDPLS